MSHAGAMQRVRTSLRAA